MLFFMKNHLIFMKLGISLHIYIYIEMILILNFVNDLVIGILCSNINGIIY